VFVSLGVLVSDGAGASVNLSAPQFKSSGTGGTITLRGDADFTAVKDEQAKDNQVIFEITGAKLEPGADLEIPTTSFAGSKLKMLKAYPVTDKPDTVRLVLQLNEAVPVELKQEGKVLTLQVGAASAEAPTTPPPVVAATTPPTPAAPEAAPAESVPPPEKAPEPSAQAAGAGKTGAAPTEVAAADVATNAEGKQIQELIESRQVGKFTGRPISINVRDVDLSDVMRLIGEASGFNIVLSDGVKGKITLSLNEVPWDQALDVILRTRRLGAERSHNILRVLTLEELTTEKQAELRAKNAARASVQKIYRIFRPSYVTELDSLKTKLIAILNASAAGPSGGEGSGGGSASATATGGSINVDSRTNSLIVYDAPESLEMLAKIIKYLDRPIAQILIESRIVEASETFSKGLSGQLGAIGTQGAITFNGDPSTSSFLGSAGTGLGNGSPLNSAIAIAAQPSISFIPGFNRLSAILTLNESEDQIKTVSNPKTVTLEDKQSAITVSTPLQVAATTTTSFGPVVTTQSASANLAMTVTPKVLADGSIKFENMTLTADDPVANQGISTRNISTQVVIENGATLMVGGVYKNNETSTANGVPLLRSIPLIGWLFGSEGKSTKRSEILFFITPRVLNEKEIGLGKDTASL